MCIQSALISVKLIQSLKVGKSSSYTFARLGRMPVMADRVPYPGGELEVIAMDGRRVAAVRVIRGVAPARSRPAKGRKQEVANDGSGE